ncbi:hypothetical protein IWZ03DRAFT_236593 [Phyllosticta citriasiana]|uniref:Secreted protein n=1 Tax=Phyllosticta citriasiana TaxID=595635 RepID=A0ABR1KH79_9PEZI
MAINFTLVSLALPLQRLVATCDGTCLDLLLLSYWKPTLPLARPRRDWIYEQKKSHPGILCRQWCAPAPATWLNGQHGPEAWPHSVLAHHAKLQSATSFLCITRLRYQYRGRCYARLPNLLAYSTERSIVGGSRRCHVLRKFPDRLLYHRIRSVVQTSRITSNGS